PPRVTTGEAPIGVTVTVPEILYLRTVENIDVTITLADLGAKTEDLSISDIGGGVYETQTGATANGTDGVSITSPFSAGATEGTAQIDKTVPNVYAIWSNTAAEGGITVDVRVTDGVLDLGETLEAAEITDVITSIDGKEGANVTGIEVPGLVTPKVGDVTLTIDLKGTQTAGEYTTGEITVEASLP
ncbi:MAG TPA: hypothetical protein VK203_13195, partial [Nostocaceae cyanobacterium]|nr:hypothetical protein [Nostocaceae cyanobacterium]